MSELSDQFSRSDQIPTKLRDSELSDSEFSQTGLGLEFEKNAGAPAKLLILQSELSPIKFLVLQLGQLGIRSDWTRNRWGSVMCSTLPHSRSPLQFLHPTSLPIANRNHCTPSVQSSCQSTYLPSTSTIVLDGLEVSVDELAGLPADQGSNTTVDVSSCLESEA